MILHRRRGWCLASLHVAVHLMVFQPCCQRLGGHSDVTSHNCPKHLHGRLPRCCKSCRHGGAR